MRKHSSIKLNTRSMEMVIDDQNVTSEDCLLLDRNGANIVQYCAQQQLEIVNAVAIKNNEPNEVAIEVDKIDPETGEPTGETGVLLKQAPQERDWEGEFSYVAFVIARRKVWQEEREIMQYYEVAMSPNEYWQPCYLENWVTDGKVVH